MSKQIPAQIKCPSCDEKINTELYRSIWIEDPKNRELIFQDKINTVTCPSCNKETFIEYPFLCTNVEKEIAIWYEPYHDPEIDKDIARYKSHMGENSFYAKAPRIKDWKEFKEKIIEYEGIKSNTNNLELSKEMHDAFSGFIGHIKKENQKNKYPKYLRHLSSMKLRLLVSPIPILLFALFAFLADGVNPSELPSGELIFIAAILIIGSVGTYFILTLLHLFIKMIAKDWNTRKDLRLWSFGSAVWIAGVLLFVIVIGPYSNNSRRDYMNADEFAQMLMIMLFPPLFLGLAKYVYDKYIK